MKVISETRRVY